MAVVDHPLFAKRRALLETVIEARERLKAATASTRPAANRDYL